MLKRVVAERRPAEPERAAASAAGSGCPVVPDLGERRLGWFVVAVVVAVVVVLAATLSRLPGWRGSPEVSTVPGARVAEAAGDAPSAGASLGPAGGAPAGSVPASPPAGGPGHPAATGVPGGPLAPGAVRATGGFAARPGTTAGAPGGAAAPPGATAPPVTEGPPGTAAPVQPGVPAALAELSEAIGEQVDAGQFDAYSGSNLQGKVQQVGREFAEGDLAAARYYADRIREKLRKYREDGMLTDTGYQVLISRLNVVDDALS